MKQKTIHFFSFCILIVILLGLQVSYFDSFKKITKIEKYQSSDDDNKDETENSLNKKFKDFEDIYFDNTDSQLKYSFKIKSNIKTGVYFFSIQTSLLNTILRPPIA